MHNRKGEELLSFWHILVMIGVGAVLVISVNIFYSADVDVREVEAKLLSDKVFNCLLSSEIKLSDENILQECGFSEYAFNEESNFYFKITFLDDPDVMNQEIEKGDPSLGVECDIVTKDDGRRVEAENFPACFSNTFIIDGGRAQVLSASNQFGRRV